MNNFKLTVQETSIVLVGSFNPAIFHPEWLLRNKLISEDDIKDQEVEIVHNDISRFSLAWIAIQVERDRFVGRTNDPSQIIPLKDLVVSIFKILEHTPITKMGMNYMVSYKMANEGDWHKVGHILAPKSIWEETLNKPVGMKSLSVECPRDDDFKGYINVSISPGGLEKLTVNITVNNHIEISEEGESLSPTKILMNYWDNAIKYAKTVAETTIKKALEQ